MRRALTLSVRLARRTGKEYPHYHYLPTLSSSFSSVTNKAWSPENHKQPVPLERCRHLHVKLNAIDCNGLKTIATKRINANRFDTLVLASKRGLFVAAHDKSSDGNGKTILTRPGLNSGISTIGQKTTSRQRSALILRSLSTGVRNGNSATTEIVTFKQAFTSPSKAWQYLKQLKTSLVEWASHMWSGMKLLAADVRGSWKVLKRIAKGKHISRRERKFLVQTGADLARLVPFSLFLIIPAAEFALPFALKLFPNMLPSQFQNEMKKEEDKKKNLKVKLELAKYLRDVVEEKARIIKEGSSHDSAVKKDAEDLAVFLEAIRKGQAVDPNDVSRFARLFNDEITIEGAVRPQLVAMCKYMGISPYGADQFLRYKIRSRLNKIKNDDMEIMWEGGVESLSEEEVVKACRERGIRTMGSTTPVLRRQLAEWLALSQDKEIPGSLMILSRAFFYLGEEGVKETLGSLTDDLLQDVKQAAGVEEVTNKGRLEEVRRQEKLIAVEEEQESRKEKEAAEAAKAAQKKLEQSLDANPPPQATMEDILDPAEAIKAEALCKETEQAIFGKTNETSAPLEETAQVAENQQVAADKTQIVGDGEEELAKQKEAIRKVAESIGDLSAESAVEKERLALEELKSEVAEAEAALANVGEKKEVGLTRFKKLVQKLEREVDKVDKEVGAKMKLLDKDNDGVMTLQEAQTVLSSVAGEKNDKAVSECLKRLDRNSDGSFSREDLRRVLRELQSDEGLDDEQMKERLEPRFDGQVDMREDVFRDAPAVNMKDQGQDQDQEQKKASASHSGD